MKDLCKEPGGLQSMGLQSVGHDSYIHTYTYIHIYEYIYTHIYINPSGAKLLLS